MSCCTQGTARLTISQADIDSGLRLRVEYSGGLTVTIVGAVTGQTYVFSGLRRLQAIHPRDATALLRDRRFRLRGLVQADAHPVTEE